MWKGDKMSNLEETILYMSKNKIPELKIGDFLINNYGIKEDTKNGKREIFIIQRYIDE